MPDEHLAVAVGARADADRRNRELARDAAATGAGTASRTRRSSPRPRVRARRGAGRRLLRRAALGLEAAEHRGGLGREPDVAHDRDPGRDDRAARSITPAPSSFGVRAGLLHEADRVADGVLVRHLERAERHVRDDERPRRAARDGAREHEHLVHRRRHGRVVAEHGHRGGVADEDEVDAGLVGESPSRCVVRRDHDDRLPAGLHLGELGEGELPGAGVPGAGFCGRMLMSVLLRGRRCR